jgi:signal transduction histidine kinase
MTHSWQESRATMADQSKLDVAHPATEEPDASCGRTLRIVNSLATAFLSGMHPHDAARQAVEEIGAWLDGVRVSCYLRDGPDTFRIVHSVSSTDALAPVTGFLAKPPTDWMRRYGDTLVINDSRTDARLAPIEAIVSELQTASLVCAPLARNGKAYGALTLAAAAPRQWTPGEVEMVTDVAQALSLGMQKARADEKRAAAEAELLAHRDHLQQLVEDRTRHLRDAKERAERADRGKTEFLSNVSHELRTPLHSILSFARLGADRLRGDVIDSQKLALYLDRIIASAESLRSMVDDLLTLSRLGTDHTAHVQASHDLGSLLDAAIWEVRDTLHARGQSVVRHFETRDLAVWCDRDHIVLALYHLLTNASKFAPEGRDIVVTVHATTILPVGDGEHAGPIPALEVSVRDQGPGIPDEELESIFEKFVQSSRTRTGAGGKGLGLAICRQIIRLHRADIRATNHPDGGAVFTFQVPRRRPDAGATTVSESPATQESNPRWLH